MKVFSTEPRFNRRTGQPTAPKLVVCGWICDYCGAYHETTGNDHDILKYSVRETCGEPHFEEMKIEGYEDQIDIYDVFCGNQRKFQFCQGPNDRGDCEGHMLARGLRNHPQADNDDQRSLLCRILYETRCCMLGELLDQKKFTLVQLGLADPTEQDVAQSVEPSEKDLHQSARSLAALAREEEREQRQKLLDSSW